MRLSANSDDPGYKVWRAMKRVGIAPLVTVAVNGVPVRACVTADTKRGIAVVADLDHNAEFQLNTKGDKVKLKRLCGKVTISFESRSAR